MSRHLLRGKTLGVLGGGQLGRMFVHAAQRLGFETCVLDPDPQSPAARASDSAIAAAYDDSAALAELARRCFAVTTEFENVPADSLAFLAQHCQVAPQADAVRMAQDRVKEKSFFAECAHAMGDAGVPPVSWARIETAADVLEASDGLLPGVLKTARMGYDGKGQIRVSDRAALAAAWQSLRQVPCVLEAWTALKSECSVIVARGHDGEVVSLPVQANEHRGGVLHKTTVLKQEKSANLHFDQQSRALFATKSIANRLNYVGVLCLEFFELADGHLRVNEMAPRPHNSGHASMDCCDQSQFDLQVRTLAGLPLVQPHQRQSAVMLNLLGDLWWQVKGHSGDRGLDRGPATEPPWALLLALPGVSLHLYGKREPRAGRKMGHLTICALDFPSAADRPDLPDAEGTARAAEASLAASHAQMWTTVAQAEGILGFTP